jgi:probable phosphoglycerate mutase
VARLYIFRHGETDWNLQHRIQGHTDVSLNLRGRRQARDLAERLESHPIEALLTSDLTRARQTAEIVAGRLRVPLFVDARLREACLGEAEGMTVSEVIAHFGEDAWRTWCSNRPGDWHFRFPNGEQKQQTLARARAGLEEFLTGASFQHIAICTHGGVIRTLVSSLNPPGGPPVAIQNCSVHILDRDEATPGPIWRYCMNLLEQGDSSGDLPPPEF